MTKVRTVLGAVLPLSLLVLVPGVGIAADDDGGPSVKVVGVDCSKGKTIANALKKNADSLIIEIKGVCEEEVVIRRDDVSIIGVSADATIVGSLTPALPFAGAVTVLGASRINLSDFLVRDSRRGVSVLEGGSASLARVTVEYPTSGGLTVVQGSEARVEDSSFRGAGAFGIAVSESSSLELVGQITANECQIAGLLLNNGSGAEGRFGSTLETSDNGFAGTAIQIGASAQLDLVARRNGAVGLYMIDGAAYAGALDVSDNGGWGVAFFGGSTIEITGDIADNVLYGIGTDLGSVVVFSGSIAGHSEAGVAVDGASATIRNSTISDDIELGFGALAVFGGGNTITGMVHCDGTELVRGDATCSSPARSTPRKSVGLAKTLTEGPEVPFVLEP